VVVKVAIGWPLPWSRKWLQKRKKSLAKLNVDDYMHFITTYINYIHTFVMAKPNSKVKHGSSKISKIYVLA